MAERKIHPGKGTIKILIEIVLKVDPEEFSVWSMSMTVPQAREFILMATDRRIGKNALYFKTEIKWYFIPSKFRIKVLDKHLHSKTIYFKKPLYVKATRISTPKPPDRIKRIHKKPSNARPLPGRDSFGVDPVQRKDVGETPVFKMAPDGGPENEYSEFDH